MKKYILLLSLFISFHAFSQTVNDYKYVIVPPKYDFLTEKDQYQLNTLTKLLMEKIGFVSFISSDDMPEELLTNRCYSLYADVIREKKVFVTKLKISLKDCKGKVLFESDYGESREKDYKLAYNLAFREASKSFAGLNYKYSGKNDITSENSLSGGGTNPNSLSSDNPEIFYFAQPIKDGFQIVNNEPRVIMRFFNTSQKNVYIGKKGDIHGVVILKNNQWFFEYYENDRLVSELLKLKF